MPRILTCVLLLGAAAGCNHAGTASDAAAVADAASTVDASADDAATQADAFADDAAANDAATSDAAVDSGGTYCDLAHPCVGASQYCVTPEGMCGAAGQCALYSPGTICPAVVMPVCGCNGMTYSNSCYARRAGQSLASATACPTGGCGSNADCGSNQFCQFTDGVCGGRGTCQSAGITLFCNNTCAPECGCDGVTYVNGCNRRKQRTALEATGTCPGGTPPC
jgi:hypothetical protein